MTAGQKESMTGDRNQSLPFTRTDPTIVSNHVKQLYCGRLVTGAFSN